MYVHFSLDGHKTLAKGKIDVIGGNNDTIGVHDTLNYDYMIAFKSIVLVDFSCLKLSSMIRGSSNHVLYLERNIPKNTSW